MLVQQARMALLLIDKPWKFSTYQNRCCPRRRVLSFLYITLNKTQIGINVNFVSSHHNAVWMEVWGIKKNMGPSAVRRLRKPPTTPRNLTSLKVLRGAYIEPVVEVHMGAIGHSKQFDHPDPQYHRARVHLESQRRFPWRGRQLYEEKFTFFGNTVRIHKPHINADISCSGLHGRHRSPSVIAAASPTTSANHFSSV